MRILLFGDLAASGYLKLPGLEQVLSEDKDQAFRMMLDTYRNRAEGNLLFHLPLTPERQEALHEFLYHFGGTVILHNTVIDISLRPALVDLFVCEWRTAPMPSVTGLTEHITKRLKSRGTNNRIFGVWLRRQGAIRREDRLFAKALDSLASTAPVKTEGVEA